MNKSLPGFDSPAVGFEQPFEMLEACHDRVRRSLALLTRLIEHVDAQGHDAQSRSAAADVQRYFDLAAPLHHQDEELHVFPVLRSVGDAELAADIELLERDHERMEGLWSRLRLTLVRWRAPGETDPIADSERDTVREFVAISNAVALQPGGTG